MKQTNPTRRAFLASTALATATLPFAGAAQARPDRTGDFVYEIQRTKEEWLEILSEYEYAILRDAGTEWAKSSDLWDDYRAGEFHCRGCDFHVYSSEWRVELDKGYVFFSQSTPTHVLMDIDRGSPYSMSGTGEGAMIEAHCRRCGSHLGHILTINGTLVHCINGTSLKFEPSAT